MKKSNMVAVAAAVTLMISGCSVMSKLDATSGAEVTQETLKSFKTGKTRREDVIAVLGHPPQKSEVLGNEVWTYPYTRITAMPFAPNVSESTVFEFGKNGLLLKAYKSGGVPGKSGNPMLDAAGM
ncbi:outer membrane protein assembly factor BamE [Luteibacter sp. NPDC031894]|uniref:outer membrane protein assembly factor BamE n=1 Tax=Luteibacter sp. NPDC031894 TaxID=3390572 RepID=UPI003CFDFA5E